MKLHVIVDTMVLSNLAARRREDILPAIYGAPLLTPSSVIDELGNPDSSNAAGRALAAFVPNWLEIREPTSVDETLLHREFPAAISKGKDVADGHIVALAGELSGNGIPVLILSDDDKVHRVAKKLYDASRHQVEVAGFAEIFCAAYARGLVQSPHQELVMLKETGLFVPRDKDLRQAADFERSHAKGPTVQPQIASAPLQGPPEHSRTSDQADQPQQTSRPVCQNVEPAPSSESHTNPWGRALMVRPLQTSEQRLNFQQTGLPFLLLQEGVQTINGISRSELAAEVQALLARHNNPQQAYADIHDRLDAAYAERRAELEAQQWQQREQERRELQERSRSTNRKPSLEHDP